MIIKPGSSQGAMWLYNQVLSNWIAAKLAPDAPILDHVNHNLNELCPPGWRFKENNGQWGLWPDDLLKYHTHSLLYLGWTNRKMKEVDNALYS